MRIAFETLRIQSSKATHGKKTFGHRCVCCGRRQGAPSVSSGRGIAKIIQTQRPHWHPLPCLVLSSTVPTSTEALDASNFVNAGKILYWRNSEGAAKQISAPAAFVRGLELNNAVPSTRLVFFSTIHLGLIYFNLPILSGSHTSMEHADGAWLDHLDAIATPGTRLFGVHQPKLEMVPSDPQLPSGIPCNGTPNSRVHFSAIKLVLSPSSLLSSARTALFGLSSVHQSTWMLELGALTELPGVQERHQVIFAVPSYLFSHQLVTPGRK